MGEAARFQPEQYKPNTQTNWQLKKNIKAPPSAKFYYGSPKLKEKQLCRCL